MLWQYKYMNFFYQDHKIVTETNRKVWAQDNFFHSNDLFTFEIRWTEKWARIKKNSESRFSMLISLIYVVYIDIF